MSDFGEKVRKAEREVAAKSTSRQNTTRKQKAPRTAWKPGESGNPETRWKPGKSPNPGGRPKKTPITDAMREHLAREYDGKELRFKRKGYSNADVLAIKQFELAVECGDMRAAEEIANRVEGKTVQVSQVQGPGGGAIPFMGLTPEENEKAIAALLAKAGAGDGDSEA